MAIISPTISFLPFDPVSIESMDGTSYEEIQQSLGSTVYALENLYIKADSNEQILQPIQYNEYDADGNLKAYTIVNAIDINQFLPALNINLKPKRIVLNGQNTFSFTILPSETVYFILDTIQRNGSDLLPKDDLLDNDFFIENLDGKI